MKSAYDILRERGFVEQVTDDALIDDLFARGPVTCYIGFDPTATSLHIGSLIPIMALAHMQKNGNRPIALVGGGPDSSVIPAVKPKCARFSHANKSTIMHNASEAAFPVSRIYRRQSVAPQ